MMPGKRAVVAMALVAAAAPVAPMATASEVKKMPSIHAGMMEQPDFDAVTCFHMPTFTGEMTPYDRLERAAQKDLDRIKFQRDHNRAYKHELQAVFTQQRKHGGTWVVDEPAEIPNLELEPIGYSRQWLGEERMGGGWSSQSDPLSDEKKHMMVALRKDPEQIDEEVRKTHSIRTDEDGNVHIMPKKR